MTNEQAIRVIEALAPIPSKTTSEYEAYTIALETVSVKVTIEGKKYEPKVTSTFDLVTSSESNKRGDR